MGNPTQCILLAEQRLAVDDCLQPYQTVELRDDDGVRLSLYGRYMSADGQLWIKHGLFQSFHPDGKLKSEGYFEHGSESGLWRDLYQSGQVAAEGEYCQGTHVGTWRYWAPSGKPETPDHFPCAPVSSIE